MESLNNVSNNYKIDDYVMYKNNGIYQIIDICDMDFYGVNKNKYYMMQAVYDTTTVVYVPVDSNDLVERMQNVLTIKEIDYIINETEKLDMQWINDSKQRIIKFEEILNNGNKIEILWLVKVLSLQKINSESQKKKLTASDLRILSRAEKIITEEFAFSLDIKVNEVISYITNYINNK